MVDSLMVEAGAEVSGEDAAPVTAETWDDPAGEALEP